MDSAADSVSGLQQDSPAVSHQWCVARQQQTVRQPPETTSHHPRQAASHRATLCQQPASQTDSPQPVRQTCKHQPRPPQADLQEHIVQPRQTDRQWSKAQPRSTQADSQTDMHMARQPAEQCPASICSGSGTSADQMPLNFTSTNSQSDRSPNEFARVNSPPAQIQFSADYTEYR